jgi:hypothetical protein
VIKKERETYAGVIRLEESNLEAFVGEVALGLGKVDGSVVGGGMPRIDSQYYCCLFTMIKGKRATDQLDKKVIFSVVILNIVYREGKLITSVHSTLCGREEKQKQSFRWNYPDQVLCLEEAIIV